MKKLILMTTMCVGTQAGADFIYESCSMLEDDYFAQKSCECSKINSDVGRLECFDEMIDFTMFLRREAELSTSQLMQSQIGRDAIMKAYEAISDR